MESAFGKGSDSFFSSLFKTDEEKKSTSKLEDTAL